MSEIHYTATKKIITGGTVTEITDRNAFISSGGTAHYENCPVVTRMLSGTGGNRMAHRSIITAEKALAGIKTESYLDCAACTKIAAKRTEEYAQNAQLIPNNGSKEETTVNENTNTEVTLPDGVKDTPSTRTVYTAMLNGAHGTVTEISKTSGVTATSVKRALTALTDAGAATLTAGYGTGPSRTPDSWKLAGAENPNEDSEPEGLELLGAEEDTTEIPGLGAIPNSTLNVLATGDPELSGNEKRVRDLLAKTFKNEWTALTDPQQATIVTDFMAGEQAEPETFNAKTYRKDIGTNNLLTYANSVMNADLGESVETDDDDMVDADDDTAAQDADLEDGWNSMNDDNEDSKSDDDQDDDSDDSEEEPEQTVAPKPVKRVAKPKLKAAGVKKGQAYGYLSGTGLAHTAKCASVKAAELGTLNIPMGPEYQHPLGDLVELVESGDIKECRLCAKLRRTIETKQVDVAKFVEFIKGLVKAKPADASIAKPFSGFNVTVSSTGKDLFTLDLRGPAANQWSRRKDVDKKQVGRVAQELVKEITSK